MATNAESINGIEADQATRAREVRRSDPNNDNRELNPYVEIERAGIEQDARWVWRKMGSRGFLDVISDQWHRSTTKETTDKTWHFASKLYAGARVIDRGWLADLYERRASKSQASLDNVRSAIDQLSHSRNQLEEALSQTGTGVSRASIQRLDRRIEKLQNKLAGLQSKTERLSNSRHVYRQWRNNFAERVVSRTADVSAEYAREIETIDVEKSRLTEVMNNLIASKQAVETRIEEIQGRINATEGWFARRQLRNDTKIIVNEQRKIIKRIDKKVNELSGRVLFVNRQVATFNTKFNRWNDTRDRYQRVINRSVQETNIGERDVPQRGAPIIDVPPAQGMPRTPPFSPESGHNEDQASPQESEVGEEREDEVALKTPVSPGGTETSEPVEQTEPESEPEPEQGESAPEPETTAEGESEASPEVRSGEQPESEPQRADEGGKKIPADAKPERVDGREKFAGWGTEGMIDDYQEIYAAIRRPKSVESVKDALSPILEKKGIADSESILNTFDKYLAGEVTEGSLPIYLKKKAWTMKASRLKSYDEVREHIKNLYKFVLQKDLRFFRFKVKPGRSDDVKTYLIGRRDFLEAIDDFEKNGRYPMRINRNDKDISIQVPTSIKASLLQIKQKTLTKSGAKSGSRHEMTEAKQADGSPEAGGNGVMEVNEKNLTLLESDGATKTYEVKTSKTVILNPSDDGVTISGKTPSVVVRNGGTLIIKGKVMAGAEILCEATGNVKFDSATKFEGVQKKGAVNYLIDRGGLDYMSEDLDYYMKSADKYDETKYRNLLRKLTRHAGTRYIETPYGFLKFEGFIEDLEDVVDGENKIEDMPDRFKPFIRKVIELKEAHERNEEGQEKTEAESEEGQEDNT